MTRVRRIGLIVEDESDYLSIRTLVKRITNQERLGFRKIVGHGCGRISNKCLSWSQNLYYRGCDTLILVHDLDKKNIAELKEELELKLHQSKITNKLVCIPVEELEAWLLSDPEVLLKLFRLERLPKIGNNPESITSPKEKLRDYIRNCSGKKSTYLNTKHNELIARHISIDAIYEKCQSFVSFHDFLAKQKY